MKTEIIFEDKSILVVKKPAGIAVQTKKIGEPDVVSELKNELSSREKGFDGYLGVIHRLDQPVEGLLVFAKTKKASADLSKKLQEGTLNKEYLAVVYVQSDHLPPLNGRLEDEIAKTPDNRAVIRKKSDQDNSLLKYQKAVLEYKLTELSHKRSEDYFLYLAEIHIETGRFHQIRAQMANAGMPILGDRKYGTVKSITASKSLRIPHVMLCADKIRFCHPDTAEELYFELRNSDVFLYSKNGIIKSERI